MKVYRLFTIALIFTFLLQSAQAQWSTSPTDNNPVISFSGDQEYHQVLPDGVGGVYVVWSDNRDNASNGLDIYAQHMGVDASKMWASDGLAVCTAGSNQNYPYLVADGSGGIIVFWVDYRSGDADIYGQRINSDGSFQWTAGGKSLVTGAGNQNFYYPYYKMEGFVMADGAGGAFFAFNNDADGDKDVYAQKVNGSGAVQWGVNGVKVTNLANQDQAQRITSDGSGGLIVIWENYNSSTGANYIYAQRLNGSGVIQWAPADGIDIVPAPAWPGKPGDPEIVPDGSGGAIIVFNTRPGLSTGDLYMQRIDASGNILWGNAGMVLANQNQLESGYIIEPAGAGNYFIVWADQRELTWPGPVYGTNYDIYAQKIDVNGNKLWNASGLLVNNADSVQYTPDMLVDGDGNLVIIWRDDRNIPTNRDIYVQKLDQGGNLLWDAGAEAVSLGSGNQYEPYIVPSLTNGYIAVWRDLRNGNDDLYSAFINPDGTLGSGTELNSENLVFIQASKTNDDHDCIDDTAIRNGGAEAYVHSGTSLWREQFLGLAAGSTDDTGATAWSLSGTVTGTGYAEVKKAGGNYEFQATDVQSEIIWLSEALDISGQEQVGFSILLRSENLSGDGFDADDYIKVYYSLDGGAAVAVNGGSFIGGVDDINSSGGTGSDMSIVNVTGLSGSTLRIIVKFDNDETTEVYAIDDIHIQGKGAAIGGYTVNWFKGAVDATPDHTGNVYAGMDAGTYNIFADNGGGSTTDTISLIIDRTQVAPTISVVVSNHETNCSTPNGSLKASAIVFGGEPGSEFDFEWTLDGDATVLGTDSIIDNLSAANYSVKVTHNVSGCESTALKEVEDLQVTPIVTATIDAHQTACDPAAPSGSLSAQVGGATAGYTFYWFEGEVANPDILLADHSDISYTDLDAGKYTVVAVKDDTGCESLPVTKEIIQMVKIDLLTAIATAANTACDAANANGTAIASVDGKAEPDYTFEWFEGSDTSSGVVVATTSSATGLSTGFFTVEATETTTGCTGVFTIEIEEQSVLPVINATVDQDNSGCDAASVNGSASADIGGTTAGFTFYWFDGDVSNPDITSADHTGATYAGIAAGIYTVVAVADATGCISTPANVTIEELVKVDQVTANVTGPNTSCDAATYDGSASAAVNGLTEPDYTFAWFVGTDTDTQPAIAVGSTVTSLGSGIHTVVATEAATGCTAEYEINIQDNVVRPVADALVDTEQIGCDATNPMGSVSANVGGQTTGYEFYWFDGFISDPDPVVASFTGPVYSNLAAGSYTVVAKDVNTACISDAVVVTVYEDQHDPVITLVLPGTDPLDPPDQFSANVNGESEPFYKFEWYKGNSSSINVNSTPIGNTSIVSGLDAGEYALRVTDLITGCSSTLDFTSTVAPPLPPLIISAIAISPYQISLEWLDRSNDEDGFIIERRKDFETEFTTIADVSSNTTYYLDEGLTPDMYYTYRVTSYKLVGNQKANSESVRLKTLKVPPAGQPTIVETNVEDPAAVTLDWTYNIPNAEGFVVERLNDEVMDFEAIGTTAQKTFVDTEVEDGKEYTYRVYAFNDGGNSGYSNEVEVFLLIEDLVAVYPNPVKDQIHVIYGGTHAYDLRLYNEDGKLIRQSLELRENHTLDVSAINSEMLVLQVWSNGRIVSKKLLREK